MRRATTRSEVSGAQLMTPALIASATVAEASMFRRFECWVELIMQE